jgi:hypothetical protein
MNEHIGSGGFSPDVGVMVFQVSLFLSKHRITATTAGKGFQSFPLRKQKAYLLYYPLMCSIHLLSLPRVRPVPLLHRFNIDNIKASLSQIIWSSEEATSGAGLVNPLPNPPFNEAFFAKRMIARNFRRRLG